MITVADVMTRDVFVIRSETTLREAIGYLASQHVSGAPVVDSRRRMMGAVTTSDLLQAESEGMDLDTTTVSEVMSRPTLTIGPDTELREAALAMEYGEVHRLFVETGGQLVGVISRTDVSRALATGRI
ncbi:MAG TPA: CBS domain-containing protein [Gemmatimonadales bacterium]|nr:CBS domain-containing protein [Gemmatimonadales bacterium]